MSDTSSTEAWGQEQERVWGTDGAYARVMERYRGLEEQLLAEVEWCRVSGVQTHHIVWLVVNALLRGKVGPMGEALTVFPDGYDASKT